MNFNKTKININTQDGILNFIRKNINHYRAITISWFGGEPLLEIETIKKLSEKIISICQLAHKPYNGAITTNGYLLTPENIEILLKARITDICVTIDGLKEQHDKQRVLADGRPSFQQIIENLKYIKDNVNTKALKVILRSNITISHRETLTEYYHYFNNIFGDDNRFSLYIRPVADYGGDKVKLIKNNFIDNMSPVYDMLSKIDGKLKFSFNFSDLNVGGSTCSSKYYNKFTISCDGYVHKCDEALTTPLGKLHADGNMDIETPLYVKWLCGQRSEECDNCFFSLSCFMEGCPRSRVFLNEQLKCHVDFNEIDSLIWWAAKSNECEFI